MGKEDTVLSGLWSTDILEHLVAVQLLQISLEVSWENFLVQGTVLAGQTF